MILVVSKGKKEAERYAEAFNIMGYLSLAVTGAESANKLSPIFRAIIVINPDNIPSLDSLIYHNSISVKIPVFAIGETEETRFAEKYKSNITPAAIIKKITRYLVINDKPQIGKYKCAGFNASAELIVPFYFDIPLKFTKTEKMILAYLARIYPIPVSTTDIIRNAIRPSRTPEPSSVRTHISSMNKKFREIKNRPIIEFYNGKGYMIITPEPKHEILK